MKKITLIAVLLTLCISIMFVGCSKKEKASAVEDTRPTIMLITDATGIDDKSFNAAAWRGILEFYGDTWENQKGRGKYYDAVTCQTQDMYIPNLKQASDEGYSLIACTGFTFADAIGDVAKLYPEQKYMIVDVDWVNQPNVIEFAFTEEQGSYLVGVLVAAQAQADNIVNPKFGFIGGVPGSVITKFEVGFIQGVRSVLPNAPVVDYYANDWGKPELAKTQAKNWFDSGVYAIFSAAGGTGGGTIAQAKEYRSQGKNVWAIGVDSDQYADGIYADGKSAVLTSMLKQVESASLYALQAIENNTFKGGVVVLDMANNGVGYSKANAELNAASVTKAEEARQAILSGTIKVYATYKDALAAGVVPANLGAKDN